MDDEYGTHRGTVTGRLNVTRNPPMQSLRGRNREFAEAGDLAEWFGAQHASTRVTRRTGTRIAAIRSRLAQLETELAAIEAVPDPAQWPAGTVLTWLETYFPTNREPVELTFAAIRASTSRGPRWYTTARMIGSTKPMTDAELREYLAGREVRDLRRASQWEVV